MTLTFTGILLAAFGATLLFTALSLLLLSGTPAGATPPPFLARLFLILLRVVIGWHCFVEGMEKLTTPGWSGETYLREAIGPAAPPYRWLAGDRLVDRLTVGEDNAFPTRLEREWRDYADAFAAYYELDDTQRQRAGEIVDALQKDALAKLFTKTEKVTKPSTMPPDLTLDMTIKQRLKEHERLVSRVHDIEAKFPTNDPDVHTDWKTAKADLAKWRAELKRDLDVATAKLKADEADRTKTKRAISAAKDKLKTADSATSKKINEKIAELTAELELPSLPQLLTAEQKEKNPMPEPIAVPLRSWGLLEGSDFLVKWSLVVLGGCLMLGFFSRLSSFATALLILSFYLAMPPLPGWPDGPRLEGHYLVVNKTLIEVIALLALTFLPTGRWAGVDGFIGLFFGGGRKPAPSAATASE